VLLSYSGALLRPEWHDPRNSGRRVTVSARQVLLAELDIEMRTSLNPIAELVRREATNEKAIKSLMNPNLGEELVGLSADVSDW